MTPKGSAPQTLVALTALALSGAVLGAANHAGSHAHGEEEAAIGAPGVAAAVSRTIPVAMGDDMRFTPAEIQVRQGETVRFLVTNEGRVTHEFSLEAPKGLLEHREQMRKYPAMEHDEPSKVTLAAGKQSEIVWQFTEIGTVTFACLIPGHYEAGMKGTVTVGTN
jgi:uncharacterized cupredoxin-like copper-binding protein